MQKKTFVLFLFLAFPEGSTKISLLSGLLMINPGQTGAEDCLKNCFTASCCCLKELCLCGYERLYCCRAWEMFLICQSRRVEGEVSVVILASLTRINLFRRHHLYWLCCRISFFSKATTLCCAKPVELCVCIQRSQKGYIPCCFAQLCSS